MADVSEAQLAEIFFKLANVVKNARKEDGFFGYKLEEVFEEIAEELHASYLYRDRD